MKRAWADGVPGIASTASTLKRAWTSGKATTLFNAALSFSMTATGVPAGAASAKKFCTSNPLNPASLMLGASGKALERFSLVTANGLTRPSLIIGSSAGMVPVTS